MHTTSAVGTAMAGEKQPPTQMTIDALQRIEAARTRRERIAKQIEIRAVEQKALEERLAKAEKAKRTA